MSCDHYVVEYECAQGRLVRCRQHPLLLLCPSYAQFTKLTHSIKMNRIDEIRTKETDKEKEKKKWTHRD